MMVRRPYCLFEQKSSKEKRKKKLKTQVFSFVGDYERIT